MDSEKIFNDDEIKKNKVQVKRAKYEKKYIKKSIRFTPEELEIVEAERQKTNLDFTNFCKNGIMNIKVQSKIEEDIGKKLIFEINRIGINLNQIAKNLHSVGLNEKVLLLSQLVEIEKAIKSLKW